MTARLLCALLLATALVANAASAGQPLVDITHGEDAEGTVAVSARGNATSCSQPWCVAVSGTGNARSPPAGGFSEIGGVAVAGKTADGGVAISGGHSTSCWEPFRCVAISAGDTSGGAVAIAIFGNATDSRDVAVSGSGDASACWVSSPPGTFGSYAVAPFGDACGGEAVTVTGDAEGSDAVSVFGDSNGATAFSGTGNAHSVCAGVLCLAASGTGHATGGSDAISACDTLSSHGRPEACTENLPTP